MEIVDFSSVYSAIYGIFFILVGVFVFFVLSILLYLGNILNTQTLRAIVLKRVPLSTRNICYLALYNNIHEYVALSYLYVSELFPDTP